MKRMSYSLKLPTSVKNAAHRLAKQDGVSLNQWISSAVAEKVGAVETAAEFLSRMAGESKPQDMNRYLDLAHRQPVMDGDEV